MSFDPREQENWAYYPGSAWFNPMFSGGYEFVTPPPMITPKGVEQSPSDWARKINARIAWFYPYTGVTPAMCMRLTGIGSQYIFTAKDSNGDFLDGARSYKLTLPPDIPESRFWSAMVYDRQTRSMLQTDQLLPTSEARAEPLSPIPTGRPTSTSAPPRRTGKKRTGSRPSPARAGSRSCASTTHCNRSSTERGDRRRSTQPDRRERPVGRSSVPRRLLRAMQKRLSSTNPRTVRWVERCPDIGSSWEIR